MDDESKLTLHGLQQYYCKLQEAQKNRKLNDLLDALEFNQVVIFVVRTNKTHTNGTTQDQQPSTALLSCSLCSPSFSLLFAFFPPFVQNGVRRAQELNKLLVEHNFPSMAIYGGLSQDERLDRYNKFKEYKSRILVSTDIFGRGVDFERVNIVFNYDMPDAPDQVTQKAEQQATMRLDSASCLFDRTLIFVSSLLSVLFVFSTCTAWVVLVVSARRVLRSRSCRLPRTQRCWSRCSRDSRWRSRNCPTRSMSPRT